LNRKADAMTGTPFHPNTRKERYSLAYVQAVAARAGLEVMEPKVDIDSVDGILRSTVGKRPQIDFQVKASAQELLRDDHLNFSLKLKNYDDLRAQTVNPRILIVVMLPSCEADWMSHTEEELVIRKCGYWVSLRGLPEIPNTTSITIKLPRSQLFGFEQLSALMVKAEVGPNL
jgi:hypothetical protein